MIENENSILVAIAIAVGFLCVSRVVLSALVAAQGKSTDISVVRYDVINCVSFILLAWEIWNSMRCFLCDFVSRFNALFIAYEIEVTCANVPCNLTAPHVRIRNFIYFSCTHFTLLNWCERIYLFFHREEYICFATAFQYVLVLRNKIRAEQINAQTSQQNNDNRQVFIIRSNSRNYLHPPRFEDIENSDDCDLFTSP